MPLPLLAPVVAALAGAALSEELADEEGETPQWNVDVGDRAFHEADDKTQIGKLYVDLLNRKILGIVLKKGLEPQGHWDFSMVVGQVSGKDVRAWVEEVLDSIEEAREDLVENGKMTYQKRWWADMKEDLQRRFGYSVHFIRTPAQILRDLGSKANRLVVDKGVRLFDEDVGSGVIVDGAGADLSEAISSWARGILEKRRFVHKILDFSEDEREVLMLLGEPSHGFDISFKDGVREERFFPGLVNEWGLRSEVLPDGSEAWRFLVKER